MFLINVIHLFKSINTTKIYLITLLVLVYTFLFCLIPNNEFGGPLMDIPKNLIGASVHHEITINKSKNINKHTMHNNIFNVIYSKLKGTDKIDITHILFYIFNRFYFCIISFTTVGYGDVFPLSTRCKLLTMSYVILFFLIGMA
jgi:hypothetical protein